jgi:transcriptional regulator with XRE-family HTH domain
MSDARRLRSLRARTGLSSAEVAHRAGIGDMAYFDLEFHDDELLTVPSLGDIKRLATVLGVPTAALFVDNCDSTVRRISYQQLMTSLASLISNGTSKEALEDEIGWRLDDFLESEARALSEYPAEFLKLLCDRLGVAWIDALP